MYRSREIGFRRVDLSDDGLAAVLSFRFRHLLVAQASSSSSSSHGRPHDCPLQATFLLQSSAKEIHHVVKRVFIFRRHTVATGFVNL